jgi:hypothetical protein
MAVAVVRRRPRARRTTKRPPTLEGDARTLRGEHPDVHWRRGGPPSLVHAYPDVQYASAALPWTLRMAARRSERSVLSTHPYGAQASLTEDTGSRRSSARYQR